MSVPPTTPLPGKSAVLLGGSDYAQEAKMCVYKKMIETREARLLGRRCMHQ